MILEFPSGSMAKLDGDGYLSQAGGESDLLDHAVEALQVFVEPVEAQLVLNPEQDEDAAGILIKPGSDNIDGRNRKRLASPPLLDFSMAVIRFLSALF